MSVDQARQHDGARAIDDTVGWGIDVRRHLGNALVNDQKISTIEIADPGIYGQYTGTFDQDTGHKRNVLSVRRSETGCVVVKKRLTGYGTKV